MKVLTTTYFLGDKRTIQIIQKDFLHAIDVVEKLFGTDFADLTLITADTKSRYDRLLETNRPPWGVTTQKKGVIYIYDPSLWRKNPTGHTMKDLIPSLIHELVHVYFFKKHITCPIWFEEGMAVKLSDENKGNKRKAFNKLASKYLMPDIINVSQNFKKMSGKLPLVHYLTFFMFVSHIFNQFGTKKIVKFLKSLEWKNDFERLFSEIFNRSPQEIWFEFRKGIEFHE